jgi:hypothetical protein
MSEKGAITIGGHTFTVRPLTVKQIRDVCIANAESMAALATSATPKERELASFTRMIDTIATALLRDHPDMTAEALCELESSLPEISAAYGFVIRLAGLVTQEKPAEGEAQAAD